MHSRLAYGAALLVLLAGSTFALASIESAHGPIPSVTGAAEVGGKPEEASCTLCHFGDRPNLNLPGGEVEIIGLPAVYAPGQAYPITVRLRSDSTASAPLRRWGFQLTAVRGGDGEGAGAFELPHPDTLQVETGEGDYASRSYVEHRFAGTRAGLAGPVEWTFTWRAPAAAVGTIHVFCAGNAADGTDDPGNDFVYTARDSMAAPGTVGAPPALAARTALAAPRPNPARGAVALEWSLAAAGPIDLAVFDVEGRRLRRLVEGRRPAGPGRSAWDGRDERGKAAPAGVYFVRLATPGAAPITRAVVLER